MSTILSIIFLLCHQEVKVSVLEVKVVVADLSLNFREVHFQLPVEEEGTFEGLYTENPVLFH